MFACVEIVEGNIFKFAEEFHAGSGSQYSDLWFADIQGGRAQLHRSSKGALWACMST